MYHIVHFDPDDDRLYVINGYTGDHLEGVAAHHDALVALVRAIADKHPAVINDALRGGPHGYILARGVLEHRAATGGDVSRRMLDHVLRSATHAIRANGQLRDAIDEWTAAVDRG